MAQFARPSNDETRTAWFRENDGTSNLFQALNDASPNDSTFIKTDAPPASPNVYVTKLTGVTDPGVDSGHTIRFRRRKNPSAGEQINLTVQLRQGYVNEGSQGTLIKSVSDDDLSGSFATETINLSTGEAGDITDYEDLFLRFVSEQV